MVGEDSPGRYSRKRRKACPLSCPSSAGPCRADLQRSFAWLYSWRWTSYFAYCDYGNDAARQAGYRPRCSLRIALVRPGSACLRWPFPPVQRDVLPAHIGLGYSTSPVACCSVNNTLTPTPCARRSRTSDGNDCVPSRKSQRRLVAMPASEARRFNDRWLP